jgi:hypothetical protein
MFPRLQNGPSRICWNPGHGYGKACTCNLPTQEQNCAPLGLTSLQAKCKAVNGVSVLARLWAVLVLREDENATCFLLLLLLPGSLSSGLRTQTKLQAVERVGD